jgi:hypothetical protein
MTTRRFAAMVPVASGLVIALMAFGLSVQPSEAAKKAEKDPRRFKFKIDPDAKVLDLLPTPPQTLPKPAPYLNEDLGRVSELVFGEPFSAKTDTEEATAHVIAKINHLNAKDADGFLKALTANRADLRGLPFRMGDACRTPYEDAVLFGEVVDVVHRSEASMRDSRFVVPDDFWKALDHRWKDDKDSRREKASAEERECAKVAALTQIFAPAPDPYRAGLAKHLASIAHQDAGRALARLAIFDPDESVRQAAIAALKGRPTREYASILMDGFRYPVPSVAKRAAAALAKLECKEVVADLVAVLEQPDPRAPVKQKIDGQEATVVREVVRINHHRNCLLCHAPADPDRPSRGILTVPVPLPDQRLPESSAYGFGLSPDIFIRTDVTYLRQDFSMMLPVENAAPWPDVQRFDFLVRTRVLGAAEAADYAEQIAQQGTPPSHLAAQHALRELTGQRPANGTPQEWRRLLKLENGTR